MGDLLKDLAKQSDDLDYKIRSIQKDYLKARGTPTADGLMKQMEELRSEKAAINKHRKEVSDKQDDKVKEDAAKRRKESLIAPRKEEPKEGKEPKEDEEPKDAPKKGISGAADALKGTYRAYVENVASAGNKPLTHDEWVAAGKPSK